MAPSTSESTEFFSSKRDRELLATLAFDRLPRHIAIIMDGNGRWAAKRGLPRLAGHKAGVNAVREAIATCIELGVPYLTLYSFSSENWRRPTDEVEGLMSLFVDVLARELGELQAQGVRVRVIGSEQGVPERTMRAFRDTERATADNATLTLAIALNYGGRDEIAHAARTIAAEAAAGTLEPAAIDEDAVAARLYTAGMPDPDLVIRTSGEMRVSNFLLWQIAYSEFWVTNVLWPSFTRTDLLRALADLQKRTRTFGGR